MVELQLSVEVAVPPAGGVTLAGDRVHVNPAGLTEEVNVTAWLNVPDEVTVIVEVPATPALTDTVVGLADIAKLDPLATFTMMVVEFTIRLFVPPRPVNVTA